MYVRIHHVPVCSGKCHLKGQNEELSGLFYLQHTADPAFMAPSDPGQWRGKIALAHCATKGSFLAIWGHRVCYKLGFLLMSGMLLTISCTYAPWRGGTLGFLVVCPYMQIYLILSSVHPDTHK